MTALRGIDVSTFQGRPNWEQVKEAGVSFAMIKAAQGRSVSGRYRLFTDSRFAYNIVEASEAGIVCGVYYYLTAATVAEAEEEAAHYLSVIGPYREHIRLWAAVDVEEERYLPRDKELLTSIVNAFCERVEAGGYRPMVYTNPNYLSYRLAEISRWELWLALWRAKTRVPTGYGNMKVWQWGSEGVSGISGKVDANLGYFELPGADYAALVCERCGLEEQTREYLDAYRYAPDLWRKLWTAMC